MLKLLSFAPDRSDRTQMEQLLDFMRLHRTFFQTELFIMVHLHDYFSADEIRSFSESALYEKFHLLLLEAAQPRQTLECERLRIIDADLCEI